MIELPEPTTSVQWQVGEYRPEAIDDIEPFDYVLVQWRENGRITWTCYASPLQPPPDEAEPNPDGAAS